MEVAVVLKASIAAATGGGLLNCLAQSYEKWQRPQEAVMLCDVAETESIFSDESDEEWIDLEGAIKFGAKVLVVAPVVIGAAVHGIAHVPLLYVAKVTGITEAIVLPCSAILHQVDECPNAMYRNYPKLVLATCWTTFVTTYTLSAIIYHHRILLLPVISSTGERFPENIVWAIGGGMSGLALIGLARGFLYGYVGQPKYIKDRVSATTNIGYLGGVMMVFVGVFSSGPHWTNSLHIAAACLSGGCTLYTLVVHSHLAVEKGLVPSPYPGTAESSSSEQVSLRNRRLMYAHITVATSMCFMCAQAGIPAAVFEYASVFFWSLTVASFNMDFQNNMVGQSPDSWGSGLGRRLSSRSRSITSPVVLSPTDMGWKG